MQIHIALAFDNNYAQQGIVLMTSILKNRENEEIHFHILTGTLDEKTKELREEKELVEKNNRIIDEQNQEIKDSITYAKRIQDALLPDKKGLNTVYLVGMKIGRT